MIEKMAIRRIFQTELSESKELLTFSDRCDDWFYAQLTKHEVIELVNDLLAIANEMIEPEVKNDE